MLHRAAERGGNEGELRRRWRARTRRAEPQHVAQRAFEATQQHVVSLVDDDMTHLAQRDGAPLVQQQQSGGRGNDEVGALFELELRIFQPRAALSRAHAEPKVLRHCLGDGADLCG